MTDEMTVERIADYARIVGCDASDAEIHEIAFEAKKRELIDQRTYAQEKSLLGPIPAFLEASKSEEVNQDFSPRARKVAFWAYIVTFGLGVAGFIFTFTHGVTQ